MSQVFRIKGRLMGRNEHDYLNRSHWSKGKQAKRDEQDRVVAAILKAKIEPMEGPIEVGINYIEGHKKNGALRDVDNIIAGGDKVILDALKEAGIIPDDNPRVVRRIYHRADFNASNPHIEVELMEYDPNGRTVWYPPVRGLE